MTTKATDWFFDLNTADGIKLPFTGINDKNLNCRFEQMNYAVKAEKGSFTKPENGSVLRISPQLNTIILDLDDTLSK